VRLVSPQTSDGAQSNRIRDARSIMETLLVNLLAGLFGGAGATLVWELAIKPRRERQAVARLLMAEMMLNRRIVINAQRGREAGTVTMPPSTRLLHATSYAASAQRLAELPIPVAIMVDWTYRYLDKITNTQERYWSVAMQNDSAGKRAQFEPVLGKINDHYWTLLDTSLELMEKALSALEFASLPVWSTRRRKLAPLVKRRVSEMEDYVTLPELPPLPGQ
jgi:hypothetical protein